MAQGLLQEVLNIYYLLFEWYSKVVKNRMLEAKLFSFKSELCHLLAG